jgi:acetylglutamate kinase
MKNEIKNNAEVTELVVKPESKSSKIVALHDAGKKRNEIAKELGIRYQFVNNVLTSKGRIVPKSK